MQGSFGGFPVPLALAFAFALALALALTAAFALAAALAIAPATFGAIEANWPTTHTAKCSCELRQGTANHEVKHAQQPIQIGEAKRQ